MSYRNIITKFTRKLDNYCDNSHVLKHVTIHEPNQVKWWQ